MDVRRHATAGRLAELFGEDALETDEFVRTMGWRRVAEQELALLTPETRAALRPTPTASTPTSTTHSPSRDRGGVHRARPRRARLPPRALDAGRLAGLAQGDGVGPARQHGRGDRARAGAPPDHTPEQVAELFPAYAYEATRRSSTRARSSTASSSRTRPAGGTRNPRASGVHRRPARRCSPGCTAGSTDCRRCSARGDGIGSNSWVVDGEHTDDRRAAAGQRPAPRRQHAGHLDADGPALHDRRPRLPARRRRLHLLRRARRDHRPQRRHRLGLHQPRPRRHRPLPRAGHAATSGSYDGRCGRCATRERDDQGRRRGRRHDHRPRRPGTARSSATSPTSTATWPTPTRGPGGPTRRATPSRSQWTALTAGAHRRRDLRARTAPRLGQLPRGGVDVRGAGAEPRLRRPRRPHRLPGARPDPDPQVRQRRARCPRRAGCRENDWTGDYVPFDGLPNVLDPDEGFIVTANQAVIGPDYPYYLTDDWDRGYRSQRIRDLHRAATGTATLSVDDMAAIQLDDRNPLAPVLVPYLLDVDLPARLLLGRPAAAAATGTSTRPPTAAARRTSTWSGATCSTLTFHDELPEDVVAGRRRPLVRGGRRAARRARRRLVGRPGHRRTSSRPATTSCAQAMRDARDELTRLDAGARPDELGVGPPAPARPAQPDAGRVRHRPGRVAVQPRRLGGRRRQRRPSTRRRGTPPRATTSTAPRRCGWSSRSPTSTTPAGST